MGDKFLEATYDSFTDMRTDADKKNRPMPYMFDFYQVTAFHDKGTSLISNTLTRIFNSFMKAMNANKLLPQMILMLLDWDLLQFVDHCSYGISMLCGQVIDWLLWNIERAIKTHKEQLRRRWAGAVIQNEPKIIWVKMINRSK